MDLPVTDLGVNPEKFEEVKEAAPLFRCDLFDSEVVHKIAQVLLLGLSTACVDNTTGDLFKGPALVAVDIKKEMVDYLTQRSETYVAESVVQEGGPDVETSDHPTDIISDFVDDFTSSKRNLFSRVSGWLLSERREDKIDDFVQEMEISKFWLMDRREVIAQILLKNIDFKNTFNCDQKFYTAEELAEHKNQCIFRSIICDSEGCSATFCALHKEKHDSLCTFKVLPCEQGCEESIMRHEMDRHCITVCPMKLVNCPFYPVGCQSTAPVCKLDLHLVESLHSHIQSVLQIIHKEATAEDLKYRMEQLEKSSSLSMLSEIRAVRSLTLAVKARDAKLGPLEHVSKASEEILDPPGKVDEERLETPNKGGEESSKTSSNVSGESPKTPSKVSEESPKTSNKVSEESPKSKVSEESPKTPSKINEESPKSKVSEESPKTPSKISEESPETPNKVSEESPKSKGSEESLKTPSKVSEESPKNKASEESPKTPGKVSEESPKTPNKVSEESPKSKASEESPKTPSKVSEDSPKRKASEESPKTPNSLREESPKSKGSEESPKTPSKVNEESPKSKDSEEESPKTPNNVSEESPKSKASEESPKTPSKIGDMSPRTPKGQ